MSCPMLEVEMFLLRINVRECFGRIDVIYPSKHGMDWIEKQQEQKVIFEEFQSEMLLMQCW